MAAQTATPFISPLDTLTRITIQAKGVSQVGVLIDPERLGRFFRWYVFGARKPASLAKADIDMSLSMNAAYVGETTAAWLTDSASIMDARDTAAGILLVDEINAAEGVQTNENFFNALLNAKLSSTPVESRRAMLLACIRHIFAI